MNANQLIDTLTKKKNNAFNKLSSALTFDETSNSNEDKIENYKDSLKLIEEAISFYSSNKNSFDRNNNEQAIKFYQQLIDIKSKTIIRVTDLNQINIVKTVEKKDLASFTPSCLKTNTNNNKASLKIKKKLDKNDISQPSDFRIIQHVGLENNSFKINLKAEDGQSKKMIDLLYTLNMPLNKKTTTFIENFVKDNGGIERFSNELKKNKSSIQETEELNVGNKQKALSFYNNSFHKRLEINKNDNKPVQIKLPTPPPTPPPPPPNFSHTENNNNRLKIHYSENKFNKSIIANTNPSPTPPPPPVSPPPPPPFPYPLISNKTSEENIYENKLSPPPPPLPTFVSSHTDNEYSQINKPTSERQNLLDSIKNFRGFSDSSSSNTQSPVQQSNHSDISIQRSSSSIIDQLKNELLKRSHYLNDSDSDDDEDNNSDTSW